MSRVTLLDVAAHAGVSRATVSQVLRNTGRITEETRHRVRESMDSLGYIYHRGAATLRTRRSGVIGLLVTDVSNPFFAAMTLGFDQAAAAAGYLTMMTDTFDDSERQARLAQSMLEYPIDALAYTPVATSDLAYQLNEFPIPILALTRASTAGAPYLGPDDVVGGQLSGEHLIVHHNYRRIVYLGGPRGAGPREDRIAGLRSVVSRHRDAQIVAEIDGPTSVPGGIALARELIDRGIDYDAVVCHSDLVAMALISVLRGAGADPSSVGVMGFDGLPESQLFWPPISSISVGPESLGAQAAGWLLSALETGKAGTSIRLRPQLDVRSSCGCPAPSP